MEPNLTHVSDPSLKRHLSTSRLPITQNPAPRPGGTPMGSATPRSLRRAYVEWVEEQIEEFKDRIPRAQLLSMADEVVTELRMDCGGQYQLTEILLCNAMDRRIFQMLKLPGYRAWCAQQGVRE